MLHCIGKFWRSQWRGSCSRGGVCGCSNSWCCWISGCNKNVTFARDKCGNDQMLLMDGGLNSFLLNCEVATWLLANKSRKARTLWFASELGNICTVGILKYQASLLISLV